MFISHTQNVFGFVSGAILKSVSYWMRQTLDIQNRHFNKALFYNRYEILEITAFDQNIYWMPSKLSGKV